MKKFFAIACCTLGSFAYGDLAMAQKVGLIDRPTPPPCAADGTCYPKTEEWGYYQGRWRTWPGVSLEPEAAPTQGTSSEMGSELTPHETPPAELEDKAAPPSSPRRRPPAPQAQPAQEGAEGETAPAEGRPATPPAEPPASPMGAPSTDADPPPAFPLSMSGRTPGRTQSVLTNSSLTPRSATVATPAATRTGANDPPPSPPWGRQASL